MLAPNGWDYRHACSEHALVSTLFELALQILGAVIVTQSTLINCSEGVRIPSSEVENESTTTRSPTIAFGARKCSIPVGYDRQQGAYCVSADKVGIAAF